MTDDNFDLYTFDIRSWPNMANVMIKYDKDFYKFYSGNINCLSRNDVSNS